MPDDFNDAIKKAVNHFDLCKPVIEKMLGCEIINIENSNNEHDKIIDMKAGIDAWVCYDSHVRGLASRIQIGKSYETFTIRCERESGALTEYTKRLNAIFYGHLYPHYTMQAYINNDELVSLAICHTKDLFLKIISGKCSQNRTGGDQIGQAFFYVVDWLDFDGGDIRIYTKSDGYI